MRLLLALILTIFNSLGFVLSGDPNLKPLLIHILRQPGPPGPSNSSVSSTPASTSTTSTVSPSTTSSTFLPSTSTSAITSSFQSSSSSTFSTSFSTSSSSTSTQQFSTSSQPQTSSFSSQSTEFSSFTSSSPISDSTSISSPTAFTSTGLAGSLTVTAVVSGPSGGSGLGNISTAKQGFFANTGAVAGTFLVVGLVGTGILICAFLWGLRRYHRRKRDKVYFDEEYREFNQTADRGATSEATLPATHDYALDMPVPSSSAPNMIEQLHGHEALFNAYPAQYQAQPGEFDPYQVHGGAYAYIDDPENGQRGAMAFAYQPEMGANRTTDYHQATTGLLHAPEGAVNPPHQDNLNNQGPPANQS